MNLQEVADRLEVHYQTVYRWVRQGALQARKVSAAYEVDEDEVERFRAARLEPAAPPERIRVRDWQIQVSHLHSFLQEGAELEARLLVDRLSDGQVSTLEICERLLTPVLNLIGQQWHDGVLTIAQERRATSIIERMIGRLSTHPRGRPRGTVVVTTPPGEEHGLPAAMAALVLRDDRWRVHHLGCGLPLEETTRLAKQVEADLVVFSTTFAAEAPHGPLIDDLLATGARVLIGSSGQTLSDLVAQARSHSPAPES